VVGGIGGRRRRGRSLLLRRVDAVKLVMGVKVVEGVRMQLVMHVIVGRCMRRGMNSASGR
jgi:hypothetical protein